MRMFIEEASTLGTLQSTDPDAAIRYLKEKQKRLSTQ